MEPSRGTVASARTACCSAGEGVLRVAFATILAVIGVKVAGPYGVVMIIASVLAIAMATIGRRGLIDPGPPAPWSELSSALSFLLIASVFTQLLASVGAVAVQLLATPAQETAAGRFQLSRIVAYVPLFLFQAVQSALLPRLSSLATAGRTVEFRSLLFRLLALVGGLGVVAIVGFTFLGPAVTRLLFGHGFELSSLDFALLSASCIGLIVTQVFGYALIALSSYRRVALGWVVGGVVFIGVAALGSQLFLRVELGLLCGAIASSAVMAALLLSLLRERASSDTEPRICGGPSRLRLGQWELVPGLHWSAPGRWGPTTHASSRSLDSADLAVIIDTDSERVRPLAERLGCAFSEDLDAAAECDAAVIATPTAFHEGAARALLELGKPILVEKPVTPDLETSRGLSPARAPGRAADVRLRRAIQPCGRDDARPSG